MFQCLSVSLVVRKRRHKYSAFCLRRPRPLVNLILAPRIYVPGLQQLQECTFRKNQRACSVASASIAQWQSVSLVN